MLNRLKQLYHSKFVQHKNWLKSVLVVVVISLVAKVLSIFKEVFIVSEFGVGEDIEGYYLILIVPVFIANAISNPVSRMVFPNASNHSYLKSFLGFFIKWIFIGAVAAFVVSLLYLTNTKNALNSNNVVFYLNVFLLSLVVILQGVNAYLLSIIESKGNFFVTSFHSIFLSISLLICISVSATLNSLVYGFVISYVSMSSFLLFFVKDKTLLIPTWTKKINYNLRENYTVLLTSSLVGGAAFVVDQLMANVFFEYGIVNLQYSYKIILVIASFVTLAIGNVLLREFSKRNEAKGNEILNFILFFVVIGGLILSILLYITAPNLISFMYERGKFTAENATVVASLFRAYVLFIPLYVIKYVFEAYLASFKAYNYLLKVAAFNLIANVSINFLFIQIFGIEGVAYSTVLSYIGTCFLALWFVKRLKSKKK